MASMVAEIDYPTPLIILSSTGVIAAVASFFIILKLPKFE